MASGGEYCCVLTGVCVWAVYTLPYRVQQLIYTERINYTNAFANGRLEYDTGLRITRANVLVSTAPRGRADRVLAWSPHTRHMEARKPECTVRVCVIYAERKG